MGPAAAGAVDLARAARFLGEALGVPSDLIRNELPPIPQTPQQEAAAQEVPHETV